MDSAIMELTTQAGLGHQARRRKVVGGGNSKHRGPETAGIMMEAGVTKNRCEGSTGVFL